MLVVASANGNPEAFRQFQPRLDEPADIERGFFVLQRHAGARKTTRQVAFTPVAVEVHTRGHVARPHRPQVCRECIRGLAAVTGGGRPKVEAVGAKCQPVDRQGRLVDAENEFRINRFGRGLILVGNAQRLPFIRVLRGRRAVHERSEIGPVRTNADILRIPAIDLDTAPGRSRPAELADKVLHLRGGPDDFLVIAVFVTVAVFVGAVKQSLEIVFAGRERENAALRRRVGIVAGFQISAEDFIGRHDIARILGFIRDRSAERARADIRGADAGFDTDRFQKTGIDNRGAEVVKRRVDLAGAVYLHVEVGVLDSVHIGFSGYIRSATHIHRGFTLKDLAYIRGVGMIDLFGIDLNATRRDFRRRHGNRIEHSFVLRKRGMGDKQAGHCCKGCPIPAVPGV